MSSLLLFIGSILFILGIGITVCAIVYEKKEEVKFENVGRKEIAGKGNPVQIARFYIPFPAECRIEFKPESRSKVIFSIFPYEVKAIGSGMGGVDMKPYSVLYKRKESEGGEITFKLEPKTEYILKAENVLPDVNIVADINYELFRIEKSPDWVLSVGLTLSTIGVVVFTTGL